MKVLACIVSLGIGSLVPADHVPTGIKFEGWRVSSSEDLYVGARHTSYPLEYLFDRDPNTAWVYSGNDYHKVEKNSDRMYHNLYQIGITPPSPMWMDELRIMNGYNKSQKIFGGNSRATEIQIYDTDHPADFVKDPKTGEYKEIPQKPIRTVRLSDTLGMKSVWLPKRKYRHLMLRFTDIKMDAVDDLCISELQLRAGGKDLIPVPKVFESTQGDDCGCSNTVILKTLGGKIFGRTESEGWPELGFSKSNDYYLGENSKEVWLLETHHWKKIRSYPKAHGVVTYAQWSSPNTVSIEPKRQDPKREAGHYISMKTIKWTL